MLKRTSGLDKLMSTVHRMGMAVFEQMWCVDWLLTATVYTKQTTGCPR